MPAFSSGWKISDRSWKQRILQGVNLVLQQYSSTKTNGILNKCHVKQMQNEQKGLFFVAILHNSVASTTVYCR
jgi:hypothetical protein